jgi:hypothetical protein
MTSCLLKLSAPSIVYRIQELERMRLDWAQLPEPPAVEEHKGEYKEEMEPPEGRDIYEGAELRDNQIDFAEHMEMRRRAILTEVNRELSRGDAEDYEQGATLFVAIVKEPALLRLAIQGFREQLLVVYQRNPGRHFCRVALKRLAQTHLLAGDQCLAEFISAPLRQIRALEVCRAGRLKIAERRLREITDIRKMRSGYKQQMGDPVIQRVRQAAVYYMQRGFRVAISWRVPAFYTLFPDLVLIEREVSHPHRVDVLNMPFRRPQKQPCQPLQTLLHQFAAPKYSDKEACVALSRWTSWLKPGQLPLDPYLPNKQYDERFNFINRRCIHGAGCSEACVPLRVKADEQIQRLAKERQQASQYGAIYLMAMRPDDVSHLMYQSHSDGRPCDDPTGSPVRGQEYQQIKKCRHGQITEWRAHTVRLPIDRRVRLLRLPDLHPSREQEALPRLRAVRDILLQYDRQHVGKSSAKQHQLASALMKELDKLKSSS